jgi:hypothetical protein
LCPFPFYCFVPSLFYIYVALSLYFCVPSAQIGYISKPVIPNGVYSYKSINCLHEFQ